MEAFLSGLAWLSIIYTIRYTILISCFFYSCVVLAIVRCYLSSVLMIRDHTMLLDLGGVSGPLDLV